MVKTAVAVFLCFAVHLLRNKRGAPLDSMIAAIVCIQPYIGDAKTLAKNRILATFMGAFYGLIALLLYKYLLPAEWDLLWYAVNALFVLLVLYTAVWLEQAPTAALAGIVFLVITVSYAKLGNPLLQVYHKVVDTCIGIFIAFFVDQFHLPSAHHREILFLIELDSLLEEGKTGLSPAVRISLNRFIEAGAKISIATWRAPAYLMDRLQDLNLNYPVLVMDGSALYDTREKEYLEKTMLPEERVRLLEEFLEGQGVSYFTYCITENTLIIYYREFNCPMEELNYRMMRKSAYRNYIQGGYREGDEVAYLRVMAEKETIERLADEWEKTDLKKYFRILRKHLPFYEGSDMLYFFNADASRERMAEKLRKAARAEKVEIIGGAETLGATMEAEDPEEVLKIVRKHYEPGLFERKSGKT